MVSSRTATAAAGVVLSLAISVAAWVYLDTLLLFLVVPFVPFLFRRGREAERTPTSRCPDCGFETRNPAYDHCPYDGTRLE
ncbi:MAG: hypothetical protein ABEJ92_09700 [Halobacteriales archaeon]